jgi:hypothetical protein
VAARSTKERWRSQGLPLLGRAAKWLAVLVVVSVMVPALTTQWSDRQKELELKTSLVAQITSSAATATQDAFDLVGDERKSTVIKNDLWRAQYRSILKEWRVDAFTLESELDAYFSAVRLSQTHLPNAFATYNEVVQNYILLSLDLCSGHKDRTTAVRLIYKYLPARSPEKQDQKETINSDPPGSGAGRRCWKKSEAFRQAYQTLGEELLDKRDELVDAVIQSDAAGYNVGFKDFVHQVLPFF